MSLMNEHTALELVRCLAECATLQADFERSRTIGKYEVDELQPLRLRGRGAGFQANELVPRTEQPFFGQEACPPKSQTKRLHFSVPPAQ